MNRLNIPPQGASFVNHIDTPRLVMRMRGDESVGSAGSGRVLAPLPEFHFLPLGAELVMKTGDAGNKPLPLTENSTFIF